MKSLPRELVPMDSSRARETHELMSANIHDYDLMQEFGETISAYTSIEVSRQRLEALYDQPSPTRHGYLVYDDMPWPVGMGYLGISEEPETIIMINEGNKTIRGINLSLWLDRAHRGRGLGDVVVKQLLTDVHGLESEHEDWADRIVWTGIRPKNVRSQKLLGHYGFKRVGTRQADREYDFFIRGVDRARLNRQTSVQEVE